MKTQGLRLPEVDCSRGAPMGRPERRTPPPKGARCRVSRISMDGDYDTGGAYWGQGLPLYRASYSALDNDGVLYLRAIDACDAIREALKTWPDATFPAATRARHNRHELFREIKQDMRSMDLKHDPYGTAMEWLFEICGELWRRGIHVPDYSPGGSGEPEEGDLLPFIKDYATGALLYAERILNAYVDKLKREGKDY